MICWSYGQKCKNGQNWICKILQNLLNFTYWTAKAIFDNFYVLDCSSVNIGPIFDFLGSPDSWDPEDFKNVLKKVKQGHTKAARPSKPSLKF